MTQHHKNTEYVITTSVIQKVVFIQLRHCAGGHPVCPKIHSSSHLLFSTTMKLEYFQRKSMTQVRQTCQTKNKMAHNTHTLLHTRISVPYWCWWAFWSSKSHQHWPDWRACTCAGHSGGDSPVGSSHPRSSRKHTHHSRWSPWDGLLRKNKYNEENWTHWHIIIL